MLQIGNYVLKGNYGVCKVEDIVKLDPREERTYYLLVPAAGGEARFYLPTDQESMRVRRVLTREEAWELLHRVTEIEKLEVRNEKERQAVYQSATTSGKPERMVSLLKYLYGRKVERTAMGRDMISIDRKYYQMSMNVIEDELSFATGESPDAIGTMLIQAMQA